MAARSDCLSVITRLLVFGGIAVLGGVLALAQVSAPQTKPETKAPPATARDNLRDQQSDRAQPDRALAQPQRQPADERQASDRGEQARQQGTQRQGLGIQFDQQTQNGLTIANVQQSSVAAQAGLRQGDRILAADGRPFNSPRQLQAYLGGQNGRRVPMIIERGGRQYTVQLPLNQPQGDSAWLGVFLNDNEENERGAIVAQVYPSGPAARAGLQAGDVIQQVNGQQVTTSADLIAAIEEMQPGSKAELSLLRNNEPTKLTATLGSRDSFVFRGQSEDRYAYGGRGSEFDENDEDIYNIPEHAMELEHNRRMAEQHQRIETELAKLRDEVRQLREALQRR
jgi:membrane-associated protease RseP (regulator of RpoE activity)